MSDIFDHAGDAGAFPLGMHATCHSSEPPSREDTKLRPKKLFGLKPPLSRPKAAGAIMVKRPWHIKESAKAIDVRVQKKWLTSLESIMACFGRNHTELETAIALRWLKARYPTLREKCPKVYVIKPEA